MKRILKSARYCSIRRPGTDRSGAEFDALLEDRHASTRDAFDVLWGAMKMQMTSR